MKKQHHFCFLFTRIQIIDALAHPREFFSHFKIYLLHNNSIVGQTKQILGISNGRNQILFGKEQIRCSFTQENVRLSSNLEIKLTQTLQENGQRVIGSYQFGINNYIHINEKLNRHCIELSIQIGENYVIYYEVFIDRIKEGVDQIIQEHQLSKTLMRLDEEGDDFLPQEIQFTHLRSKTKEIKLNSEHYVVIQKRYWSPTWLEMHPTPKKQAKRRQLTKRSSINESQFSRIEQQNGQSFLRDQKIAESTIDDFDKEERLALSEASDHEISLFVPQIEQGNDSDVEEKAMAEIYQVISSNSKITLPSAETAYQICPKSQINMNKSMRSSRKIVNASQIKKYVLVFIILLLSAMALLECSKVMKPLEKKILKKSI